MLKNTLTLLALSLFFCFIQCKKDEEKDSLTFELNKPFEVKPYSVYTLNDKIPLGISLKKVISDSRCPKDAICIWAGSADMQLYLNYMNNSRWDTLASMPYQSRLDSTIFSGYVIKLTQVTPERMSGKEIAEEDYRLTLLVTKK